MMHVTITLGDFVAESQVDAKYSPDILDDMFRQARMSLHAWWVLDLEAEGDDLDDVVDPDGDEADGL